MNRIHNKFEMSKLLHAASCDRLWDSYPISLLKSLLENLCLNTSLEYSYLTRNMENKITLKITLTWVKRACMIKWFSSTNISSQNPHPKGLSAKGLFFSGLSTNILAEKMSIDFLKSNVFKINFRRWFLRNFTILLLLFSVCPLMS